MEVYPESGFYFTLFSLFSNNNHKNIDLCDFEGQIIPNRQRTTEEKAVILNLIFDMQQIQHIARSYGLDFSYSMVIHADTLQPQFKTQYIIIEYHI
jgi:hypothetical protein